MTESSQIEMPDASPAAVEGAQHALGRAAGGFERGGAVLSQAQGATGTWQGRAKVSFDGKMASHRQAVGAVNHALAVARGAMKRYHTALADARAALRRLKGKEDDALVRLRDAKRELTEARGRLRDAQQRAASASLSIGSLTLGASPDPIGLAEQAEAQRDIRLAEDDIDAAGRKVGREELALERLRDDARRVHRDLTEAENTAAGGVRSAAAELPDVAYPGGAASPSPYAGTAFGPISTPFGTSRAWQKANDKARRAEARWLPRDKTEESIRLTASPYSTAVLPSGEVLRGADAEVYRHRHSRGGGIEEGAQYPGAFGQFMGTLLAGKQVLQGKPKDGLVTFLTSGKNPAKPAIRAGRIVRGADRAVTDGHRVVKPDNQFWRVTKEVDGVRVHQRDDLIDPVRLDSRGRSNLERMNRGLAPIGPDGAPVNLHHTTQTASSPLAETTQTFHQSNGKVIHINPNSVPSGIDRSEFASFRRRYWAHRAHDFAAPVPGVP